MFTPHAVFKHSIVTNVLFTFKINMPVIYSISITIIMRPSLETIRTANNRTSWTWIVTSSESNITTDEIFFRLEFYFIHYGLNGYCHTRLHLGISAKLRIWQVSACKMEPQSVIIICLNRPPDHINLLPEKKTPHISNLS